MEEDVKKKYDMLLVRDVFFQACRQCLSNLSEEQSDVVYTALVKSTGSWNSHMVLTPDILPKVAGEVFGDATLRNFYLNLKFVFFTNMAAGFGVQFIDTLIFDLATSVSYDMGLVDAVDGEASVNPFNAMPPEVQDTLLSAATAYEVMRANTWVVVIMLFLAFVDLDNELINKKDSPKR